MNIAKPLNDWSLQQSPKKPFPYWIKRLLPSLLFASLLGTYLDLFFVGKGLYSFPTRPFSSVFSIHIGFALVALPCLVAFFLVICDWLKPRKKIAFLLLLSLLMSVFEKMAEDFGLFIHTTAWKHLYSFFGYTFFLIIIYLFFKWTNRAKQ